MAIHMFTATLDLGEGHAVSGFGRTKNAALSNLMKKVREGATVLQVLKNGTVIPAALFARLPKDGIPKTHGILIFERHSHSSGEVCEHRVFAIRRGRFDVWIHEETHYIGSDPCLHSFLDSNSEYNFPLPEGSLEFAEGVWVPRIAAVYSY